MTDGTGRVIDYLRVSVTDRCNLRCVYCMPPRGVEPVPHREMLTLEEIGTICGAAARLGVTRVKLTGGEPLVRKGCPRLVEMLKAIPGIREVTITTNGILLPRMLGELTAAGLDGVNISLDTLDPVRYKALTRYPLEGDAREAIHAALGAGLRVKVNCVPIREHNDRDLEELAALARDRQLDVRFIELMPVGMGAALTPIPGEEVRQRLEAAFGPMEPYQGAPRGNGPAVYYSLPGFTGKIGFISAVSHRFCGDCNRVRLTSTGFLKLCLHYSDGVPLRELARSGAGEEELARVMAKAIRDKPLHHDFGGKESAGWDRHTMSQIGG